MKEDEFVIEKIGQFQVVRDDLHKGGTKRRALKKMVNFIKEKEFVYACDYYGHAAYAIALTAQDVGKKVMLFYLSPKIETDIFLKTVALSNVEYTIVDGATTQIEASKEAIAYAEQHGAHFFPIGLDFPEFQDSLTDVVSSAGIEAPEIWCLGGSGTLGRSLKRAYPSIPVHVVSVGTANFNGGDCIVYEAPELFDETAHILPPYPSSLNYDAKTWRFVASQAQDGACIWNVAQ